MTRVPQTDLTPADPPSLLGNPWRLPARPAVDDRVRAYDMWQVAGRPEGDAERFWLEAERELRA